MPLEATTVDDGGKHCLIRRPHQLVRENYPAFPTLSDASEIMPEATGVMWVTVQSQPGES